MAKLPKGEAAMNDYFLKYKRDAIKRKLKFELTKQEFVNIVNSNCHYCGCTPNRQYPGSQKYNGNITVNGIDRKDPSIGYNTKNCVPACLTCNFGKQKLNLNEFHEWIKKVYIFLFGE